MGSLEIVVSEFHLQSSISKVLRVGLWSLISQANPDGSTFALTVSYKNTVKSFSKVLDQKILLISCMFDLVVDM